MVLVQQTSTAKALLPTPTMSPKVSPAAKKPLQIPRVSLALLASQSVMITAVRGRHRGSGDGAREKQVGGKGSNSRSRAGGSGRGRSRPSRLKSMRNVWQEAAWPRTQQDDNRAGSDLRPQPGVRGPGRKSRLSWGSSPAAAPAPAASP